MSCRMLETDVLAEEARDFYLKLKWMKARACSPNTLNIHQVVSPRRYKLAININKTARELAKAIIA